jgi:hypothetical protein
MGAGSHTGRVFGHRRKRCRVADNIGLVTAGSRGVIGQELFFTWRIKMSQNFMLRAAVTLAVLVSVSVALESRANACLGLFRHRCCCESSCSSCSSEPSCGCASSEPSCAAPAAAEPSCAAPAAAAPAEPSCAAPAAPAEPSCGCAKADEPSCGCSSSDSCCCHRHRLFSGLFRHRCCCQNSCGCSAAPSCGCSS